MRSRRLKLRTYALVLIGLFALQGCRYYSLYVFSEQFCEFDRFIDVREQDQASTIDFDLPVVPRDILLRYLKASPTLQRFGQNQRRDLFQLERLPADQSESNAMYQMEIGYHYLDETPLLSNARIDPAFTPLFNAVFVEQFLRSACTDDFSISFSKIEVRFDLSAIPNSALPKAEEFDQVFGVLTPPEKNAAREQSLPSRSYLFDFIHKDLEGQTRRQAKQIQLHTQFGSGGTLSTMTIRYMNYLMNLDFESARGELIANR